MNIVWIWCAYLKALTTFVIISRWLQCGEAHTGIQRLVSKYYSKGIIADAVMAGFAAIRVELKHLLVVGFKLVC